MSTLDSFGNPVVAMVERTSHGYAVSLSAAGVSICIMFGVLLVAIVAGVWVHAGHRREQ